MNKQTMEVIDDSILDGISGGANACYSPISLSTACIIDLVGQEITSVEQIIQSVP